MAKVSRAVSEYMKTLARRRAKSLTAERRREIAKKAAAARWNKTSKESAR